MPIKAGEVELTILRLRSLPFETQIIKKYQTRQSSVKAASLVDALGDFYPEAEWRRCVVHWYRNAFNKCPHKHAKTVSAMLKAIHAQEDKDVAREKAGLVAVKLRSMKLESVARFVEEGVEETLSYMDFSSEHWRKIRTNNGLERSMKEIRMRTRVVGSFPYGYSDMMLVGARLRHISTAKWGTRQCLSCKMYEEDVIQKNGATFIINQKKMCAKITNTTCGHFPKRPFFKAVSRKKPAKSHGFNRHFIKSVGRLC